MALGLWGHGYYKGYEKYIDFKTELALKAEKVIIKQGAVTEKVIIKYKERAAKTRVVTKVIKEEVIKYVQSDHTVCNLDDGWISLHDNAATLSEGAGRATGPPGETITTDKVLETVTENYARHHRTADRLEALQEWVKEQQKVKNE